MARKNAPHSETFVLGNHMMFREYPEKFNAAVDAFFRRVQSQHGQADELGHHAKVS